MIKKPIAKPLKIALAIASMVTVVLGYGVLAASQADHGLYNKSFPSLTQLYYGLGAVLATVDTRDTNDDAFADIRSAQTKVVRYHTQIEDSAKPDAKPEDKLSAEQISKLNADITKLEAKIKEYEGDLVSPLTIMGKRAGDCIGGIKILFCYTFNLIEDFISASLRILTFGFVDFDLYEYEPNSFGEDNDIYLYVDFAATMDRLVRGISLAILGGLILGFMMGTIAPIEAFLNPPMSIASKLNPIAMLAVFFVVVGSGENLYLSMIVFGTLPALTITVYLAIKNDVPDELIYKAYTLGASHAEVIGLVIFRKVLPHVIEGIRAMVGPALVYLIAAEWAIGSVGFGYRLRLQSKLLDMQLVFAYIAFLAIFGYLLDLGLVAVLKFLCPWHTKTETEGDGVYAYLKSIFKGVFGLSDSPAKIGSA